jgi:hypothetical protein
MPSITIRIAVSVTDIHRIFIEINNCQAPGDIRCCMLSATAEARLSCLAWRLHMQAAVKHGKPFKLFETCKWMISRFHV